MILATSFWEKIIQWDRNAFIQVNSHWTNPFFDTVMPFLRTPAFWVPVYLFVLVFVLINFRLKALWWILFFVCTIALTDMTGTYLFKHNFERYRPCNDPLFYSYVRKLVEHCAGHGFTSNHAANHFGMAAFFFVTFRHLLGKITWLPFIWAGLICYAQVYVGLHYPLDVICGALIGLIFGFAAGNVFNKRFGIAIFDNQPVA